MANECQVIEQILPRSPLAPVRVMPPLAKQTLSSGGVSAAFNKSTNMVTVVSSLAGTLEFTRESSGSHVDPDGTGDTFPINANQAYDFSVRGGTKVRFV